MYQNLPPSPANGPLRPKEPITLIQLMRELIQLVSKMLDKLNQTAFVVVAAFMFKGASDAINGYQMSTDAITLFGLGSYLTLRLLEIRQKL